MSRIPSKHPGAGSTSLDLPEPAPELMAISRQLVARMAQRIQSEGPMSLGSYMDQSLYEPGLGYYSAGLHKLGKDGDFQTAPEMGEVLARSLAPLFLDLARQLPADWTLMEIGAGSGAFLADLLPELSSLPPAEILVLETSADLRQRQQKTLADRVPDLLPRIRWLDTPPERMHGIVFGNEVVDALPVERFRIDGKNLQQQWVDLAASGTENDAHLELTWDEPTTELAALANGLRQRYLEKVENPYVSELIPALPAWLQTVTAGLHQGAVLLLDYGYSGAEYYHPQRDRGSLRCFYRQRMHEDLLFWPGLQDLTASVDFTALAEAGARAGLELLGYTSQAGLLMGTGLPQLLVGMEQLEDRPRLVLAEQVKRLTLPGEMGERVQAMLLGRGMQPVAGFDSPDLTWRL